MLEGPDVRDELRQVLVLRSLVRRQGDGGFRQGLGGGISLLLGDLENSVSGSLLRKQIAGRHPEVLLHHDAVRILWRTRGQRSRPPVAHERRT